MWWRKRTRETKIQTAVSEKVGKQLDRIQNKWVSFMKEQEGKCSLRQKKIAFILFCLIFGGGSLAILVDTFVKEKTYLNRSLPIPTASPFPVLPNSQDFIPLNGDDTANLIKLRKQLDTLSLTTEGREQLKAFNKRHPGVLNKLHEFEE